MLPLSQPRRIFTVTGTGLAFTTGIRDIGNQDYISGAVRMLDALLTIFSVALGVGLTISFLHRLVGGIL